MSPSPSAFDVVEAFRLGGVVAAIVRRKCDDPGYPFVLVGRSVEDLRSSAGFNPAELEDLRQALDIASHLVDLRTQRGGIERLDPKFFGTAAGGV